MNISKEHIGTHLLQHNIKPSYPRIRILEYLVMKKNHPTVEEMYSELVKELPTLSKTTLYNTLNLFMNANLARLITIEENETRYDADISDHGHFKCIECGVIYDFPIHFDAIVSEGLNNFLIHEKNVYYKGICLKCHDNKNKT